MTAKICSALCYAKAAQTPSFAGLGASNLLGLSLPQDYLNVRGHVRANVMRLEGPGGLTVVVIVMVTAQIL